MDEKPLTIEEIKKLAKERPELLRSMPRFYQRAVEKLCKGVE